MLRACWPNRIHGKAHGKAHSSSTGKCHALMAVTPSLPLLPHFRTSGFGKQAGAAQETILHGQERQWELTRRANIGSLPTTGTPELPGPGSAGSALPPVTSSPQSTFPLLISYNQ